MRIIKSAKRECGLRTKGGVYLATEGSPDGILPMWVSCHPPIPCEDRIHRGPVLVDADAVLAGLPENEWFVGSSEDHRDKLRADEWALQRFGMTTTMRLRAGVCRGMSGVDEAMEWLLKTVQWNGVHIQDAILNLTTAGIEELPRVAPHFASFIQHIQNFPKESLAEELVLAAAATWRMADCVPASKTDEYIPHLMRILTVLGLGRDALYMRKRYM